jgi:PAS domain-containing protein
LEGKILRKDGQEIPVETATFTIKIPGGYLIYAFVRDITERKLAEEEIRETRDYLDNIIESSLDCIIVSDNKGYLTRVNKSFLEMLDCKKEEVIGKHMTELVPIDEGVYESTTGETVQIDKGFINDSYTMISRLVEEGKISQWESYFMRKDKKVIPTESNSVYLYNEKGDKIGSVGIIRDITKRRKAEKELQEATLQLVQSEKLSSLGELTAGVAHELNQPLNGIKIISQSLISKEDSLMRAIWSRT